MYVNGQVVNVLPPQLDPSRVAELLTEYRRRLRNPGQKRSAEVVFRRNRQRSRVAPTRSGADTMSLLLPHHRAELDASGISPAVSTRRGTRSVTAGETAALGFAPWQQFDGLLFPAMDARRRAARLSPQSRPTAPR